MNREFLLSKLADSSGPPDAAGHITWTGFRDRNGRPVIKHRGEETPAASAAFTKRTGRRPVGMARADCNVRHCVAPDHVADDIERRTVRLQLRAIYGWKQPWSACPAGHGWDLEGRVEPDLTLYCRACNTERSRDPKGRKTA